MAVTLKLARYYTTGAGASSNTAFAAIYRELANGDITKAEAKRKLNRLIFLNRVSVTVPTTKEER